MLMPEDVVFNILVRLPVISLLRFKSVCKSWCAAIESSHFTSQHHRGQKSNLVIRYISNWSDKGSFSFHSDSRNFELPCNRDLPLYDFKETDHPNSLKLVASCNGLICLSEEKFWGDLSNDGDITLWNPATKQVRTLPEPLFRYPPNHQDRSVLNFVSFGFGFDVKTNDYKVIRIIIFQEKCTTTKSLVEIYSLRTNSWRIIDVGGNGLLPIEQILFDPHTPFYHNGIYCWFGTTRLSKYSILSFDFINEVFGTIPLPENFQNIHIRFLCLAFVVEDLAYVVMVGDPVNGDDCHFEIWVLNDYGVKQCWTKQYMIDTRFTHSALPRAIWFSPYGKFFLLVLDRRLRLCDPFTGEIKDLQIRNNLNSLQVAPYKKSLVSI